ncbi:MAG: hypothetical protein DHS20C18_38010 [Saprospiraceae bacterium]|nr:MAG: hypothetical protein DHS20C18_38010 [Saprospiraceae bacterium]
MKYLIPIFCIFLFANCKNESQHVVTSDIDLFWKAYDQIITTEDSTEQLKQLKELYLDQGSPGLNGIIRARNYTPQEYLGAINDYPLFWASVRENTYQAKTLSRKLEVGVHKLKQLYPDLKPAKIYFTIGALRTNGTVIDSMLLIGSELAMGDENTVTTEFPERLGHLPSFFKNNPIKSVVALNIHEYIHTQQNAVGGYDLLSQSVFEGVAEFVPVIALGEASTTPAINYGKANENKVKESFSKELFSPWIYNWIWNSLDNEFGVRDLGYYVGYAMAEKYYEQATDKKQAIKDLIELDYQDQEAIEAFVDKTHYFDKSIEVLKREFEDSRPTVVNIVEFENGSQQVNPNLEQLTIEFSTPMDQNYRSTDFGELGKDHCPEIKTIKFNDEGTKATYFINLEPNKHYQMLVDYGYRTLNAIPLKPFLIEFSTTKY